MQQRWIAVGLAAAWPTFRRFQIASSRSQQVPANIQRQLSLSSTTSNKCAALQPDRSMS